MIITRFYSFVRLFGPPSFLLQIVKISEPPFHNFPAVHDKIWEAVFWTLDPKVGVPRRNLISTHDIVNVD